MHTYDKHYDQKRQKGNDYIQLGAQSSGTVEQEEEEESQSSLSYLQCSIHVAANDKSTCLVKPLKSSE